MKISDEMKARLKCIADYMKEYSSEDLWDELNNFVPKVEYLEKRSEKIEFLYTELIKKFKKIKELL